MKMHIIEQAKSLLDFNQKLDISLLDGIVNLMYNEHGDMVRKGEGGRERVRVRNKSYLFCLI
jgi:hypothetical protein